MSVRLTNNFTLEELSQTSTGLPNNPGTADKKKLLFLATYILQPTRDKFGKIRVNSGYRSHQVNQAIKGAPTSQHLFGEAADILPLDADIYEVFKWMRSELKYGQIIFETNGASKWIHVSLPRLDRDNQMILIATYNEETRQYDYLKVVA